MSQAPTPAASEPPLYALATAGVLLLMYVGLTLALMFDLGQLDERWDHAMIIYNGFTAFAVAAGGVLLGAQIQRANVTAARQDAAAARNESHRVKEAVREALAATSPSAATAKAGAADLDQLRVLLSKAL